MNTQLQSKLSNLRGELRSCFLEREQIIDGVLASMITGQNCFLFGAPGTGKSELVRSITKQFNGLKFFSYLLSPTTDPSELYGPVAVSKLLQDEYTRDTKGYLPDANVVFLDELFRGSSAVLNSLLQVLNERTFNNGKELVQTDIYSVVAATNSFPTEESLQAFCDRFLFRPTVEGLKKSSSKRKLYEWAVSSRPVPETFMSQKDLLELKETTENVKVDAKFMDSFSECMDMLEARGIYVSDRRRVQTIKFLRGWAVVNNESSLYPEFLYDTLKHIVYQTQEDISVIQEVVEQCVPTAEKYFQDASKAATGVMAEFRSHAHKQVERISELSEHVRKLKDLLSDMETVRKRAEEKLDDGDMRMSAETRMKAIKICQRLSANCTTISEAISRYQK